MDKVVNVSSKKLKSSNLFPPLQHFASVKAPSSHHGGYDYFVFGGKFQRPVVDAKKRKKIFSKKFNLLYVYNPISKNYVLIDKDVKISPRFGSTMIVRNCSGIWKLYIHGGVSNKYFGISHGVNGDFFEYNLRTKKTVVVKTNEGKSPILFGHSSLFSRKEKKMFVFGGEKHHVRGTNPSDELHSYDFHKKRWEIVKVDISESPNERSGHTMNWIDSKETTFAIFGGANLGKIEEYNDLWEYSVDSQSWKALQPKGTLPPKRHDHSSIMVYFDLYIYGGVSGTLGSKLKFQNSLWRYNFSSQSWTQVKVLGVSPIVRFNGLFKYVSDSKLKMCIFAGEKRVKMKNEKNEYNVHLESSNLCYELSSDIEITKKNKKKFNKYIFQQRPDEEKEKDEEEDEDEMYRFKNVEMFGKKLTYCGYCGKVDMNPNKCLKCKKVRYCSSKCLETDKEYHVEFKCSHTKKSKKNQSTKKTKKTDDSDSDDEEEVELTIWGKVKNYFKTHQEYYIKEIKSTIMILIIMGIAWLIFKLSKDDPLAPGIGPDDVYEDVDYDDAVYE